MEKIVRAMLKCRVLIVLLFIGLAVFGFFLSQGVRVNYNMSDYLPENAPSSIAIDVMQEQFDSAIPNLRVMVQDASIPEALAYKKQLQQVNGVSGVTWLDEYINIRVPLKTQDPDMVEQWYKDGYAIFSMVVDDEAEIQEQALSDIRDIIGPDGAMTGSAVDSVEMRKSTVSEVTTIVAAVVPLAFVILFITTNSWFEPVLFLCNVGVAVMLNMGTNFFLGEISNITQTTAGILQLACSMDYAIFFLDRFGDFRREGLEPTDALIQAVTKSTSSILASGLTTVVGFASLIVMQFRIGADMGFVLAKGIVFSLLTTILFMTCITAIAYPLIDKTSHRSFLPSFDWLGKAADKIKGSVSIAVIVLLVPCYLAGQNNSFIYGMESSLDENSQAAADKALIDQTFGKSNTFVLLVPTGSMAYETAIANDIKKMQGVNSIMSYAETVGSSIPSGFLPEDTLKQLNSEDYTRIVIITAFPAESRASFSFVEQLRETAEGYYPGAYYLAGETVTVYDMKDTITGDSLYVNLITIGAIAVILLLTFRSVSLPIILLLTIESAIFINFAIPYFAGSSINYIGYLIISSVSLGATIDYAILFTNRYYENREFIPKKQAARRTIADTAKSILTSGGILIMAGVVLGIVSSNGIISELGSLLARGAALSVLFVLVFLPAMLVKLEGVIKRTTMRLRLFEEPKEKTPAVDVI